MRLHTAVLSAGLLLSGAQAAPAPAQADLWSRWVAQNFTDSPSVVQTEKYGTYVGLHLKDVKQDQFFGIPFATPPVGKLRFNKPQPPAEASKDEVRDATRPGLACIQPLTGIASMGMNPEDIGEDCLVLNVYRPHGVKKGDNLPVMLWIYGGSWQQGRSTDPAFNATDLISHSVSLGQPIVYVSINYRLGAFGFLGGAETDEADADGYAALNAGYWDQRRALHWVRDNIEAWGGDKKRITIFGESAGASSVAAQMLANKGNINGLFRAAIMESGGPATFARYNATEPYAQNIFNGLANATGCNSTQSSSSNSSRFPILDCLRSVNASTLDMANTAVINASTQAFPPLLDRFFVAELPSAQLAAGRFPDIPFISGNNLDEGTLFAPRTITNDTGLGASLVLQYGEGMRSLVPELLKLYPQDPAAGSPFRSELQGVPADDRFFGPENQYKRAASILGDLVFQATRRSQLSAAVKKNKSPVWSYLFSQPSPGTNATTSLGVYHSSEILYVYAHPPAADAASDAAYAAGQTDTLNATQIANAKYAGAKDIEVTSKHMSSAWIHFANSLSPNGADAPHWPSYGKEEKMIQFQGSYNTTIIKDDYRKAATDYLNANAAKIHL